MKSLLQKVRTNIDSKSICILYELTLQNKNDSICYIILTKISDVLYALENL